VWGSVDALGAVSFQGIEHVAQSVVESGLSQVHACSEG
jgi:hypothetical protein